MPEIIVHSDGGQPQTVLGGIAQQVIEVQMPGLQGRPGAGLSILGVFTTYANFIAAHPAGAIGEGYLVGADVYIWDDITSNWIDVGPLRGETGADGKPGQIRFTGAGAPGTIIGSSPLDTYLDTLTGDIWTLT